MKKRLNLYEISNILGFLYQDDVINLPAISTVNDVIEILGYEGRFGLDEAGRPAFRPKKDETQYTISDDGDVVPYAVDYIDEGTDKGRKSIGNCFETKEEAERAVEKLKAWKRMEDTGCKPIMWKWKQDYPNDACYVEVVLKCQFDSGVHDKELELLFGGKE